MSLSLLCRSAALALILSSSLCWADEVVPPEVLTRAEAKLPVNAAAPEQDHVLLEFTIGVDGKVSDVVVVESAGPAWDQSAKDALLEWTFRPARHQGQLVESRTRLPFNVVPPAPPDAGVPLPQEDAGVPVRDGGVDDLHPEHELSTTVMGRSVGKSRGASDFHVEIGALQAVPRASAAELLKLAPGVLLTNEGGALHPESIFLRGFDAKEGQDIELSVDGMPVNDSGNLHGNGFADLHFLIPELVESVRVIEGPFDPRQGNYAVAGSADYELGLAQRGLTVKGALGTYNSQRLVMLWRPPTKGSRTFAGGQLFQTGGYGQNRDARAASVMAQYEGEISESTSFRVFTQGYLGDFHSAGVLRADDVRSGAKGFYDTYDFGQGGDSARASLGFDIHGHGGPFTHHHQAFFIYRSSRLRENFTGFVTDVQKQQQTPHPQRGDLLDRDSSQVTVGARGWAKWKAQFLGHSQELELGYFGRLDVTRGISSRIDGAGAPYRVEQDLDARLGDIGLYADGNLQLRDWLVLRGGLRADLFTWNVNDNCFVTEVRRPAASNPPGDASCLDQKDLGVHRERFQRSSTTGATVMPRATLLVGPFKGITASLAYGEGVRSIDPQFVSQDLKTPFASIRGYEGGAAWSHDFAPVEVTARAAMFGTHVDKDLIFSEQAGRNIVGGGTTRIGGLVAGRARGDWFDVSLNGTLVRSTFDDTGQLVPYVPDLVLRLDAALFRTLPFAVLGDSFRGQFATGITFVGRRPLPFGQRSDVIFTVDSSLEVGWRTYTLGVQAQNLFDTQYRLAEFNYVSDFQTSGSLPTLVPARHFTAGAPRTVWVTLSVNVGGP